MCKIYGKYGIFVKIYGKYGIFVKIDENII